MKTAKTVDDLCERKKEMNKPIVITALFFVAVCTAISQASDPLVDILKPPPIDPALTNLPPLGPIDPIPETPRGRLLPSFSESNVITKANWRLWSADFTIEMRDVSPTISNLAVNVVLERKYKLEHIQSVDLFLGELSGKNEMMGSTFGAKLFVSLWRRHMLEDQQAPDAAVYSSFVLSRDLAKEAFLRIECAPPAANAGRHSIVRMPSVYLIDLNSFVPPPQPQLPPPPPSPVNQREKGDDAISIEFI